MKAKNVDVMPKNKAKSAVMIFISLILFVCSAIFIYLGLSELKAPVGPNTENINTYNETDFEQIKSTFNNSVVSVVLDEVGVKTLDSLKNQTFRIITDDADNIINSYIEYLESLKIEDLIFNYVSGDFDEDGEAEYYLEILVPVRVMFTAIGREQDAQLYEDNVAMPDFLNQRVVLYGDSYDGAVTFRSYYSENDSTDTAEEISARFGVLNVSYGNSTPDIFIVCKPYAIYDDYSYHSDAFVNLCDSYSAYLGEKGYKNIYYYCADVCDADGEEVFFVYFDKNDKVYVRVLAFIGGKAHFIYENLFDVHATYIIEKDGKKHILEYSQVMGNSKNNYTAKYHYDIFRFNTDYLPVSSESKDTEVSFDKVEAENESFFAAFNNYLKDAFVIADPYELTGYKSLAQSVGMSTHETDNTQDSSEKYLYISNCSTSKQGIVNVPETTHLNFRKGPSVDYPKILINPADSESFVRQLKGSIVTVIDTVNTVGDEENPVWLKINIKYNDLTLEGYSSQSWIDLPGIRTLYPGDKFTVNADTNDGSLVWRCNDTSVARINSETGELTALKSGVVLVTVTSESGLTDSCLIAVK